jgi:hypothetical protein
VAALPPVQLTDAVMQHATNECSKHVGPVFTDFAYMLLCFIIVTGMDPPALRRILEEHVRLLREDCGGAFPDKFWFVPKSRPPA